MPGTIEQALAGIREEQKLQRYAMARMLDVQRIHGDMLQKILVELTREATGKSPLEDYMAAISEGIGTIHSMLTRVLDIPPEDSDLSNRLADLLALGENLHGLLMSKNAAG
jgi:hypothetical protein